MENNNLTSQAYHLIMKKIIDAEYQPGQKITEKQVENELGIGRTPVREALIQLRQENLLNVIPQSGTYISKIDMQEVLDARFVRVGVEQRIMHSAATMNLTTAQLNYLSGILAKERTLMHEGNFVQFLTSDDEFHRYFYLITNHERIWEWIKTINIQFDRFRFLRLKVKGLSWDGLVEQHEAIFNAVKAKDANKVEQLTADHLQMMLKEEQALTEAFPDYFVNYSK
jgi:DNA-binding GntR family transcriptional regulator